MTDEFQPTSDDEFLAGFNDVDQAPTDAPVENEPEPVVEAAPEPEPEQPLQEPEQAPAPPPDPAPWEDIPEEHRDRFVQLAQQAAGMEQSFRSEQNRAVGQQRRADELQARVADLESRLANRDQTPAPEPVDETMQALDASLPEVAEVFRRLQKDNEQLRAEIDRRVQPVEQSANYLNAQAQEAALDAARTGWRNDIASANFAPTMARAPRLIREAFEQNSAQITSAEDAAFVIDWYRSQQHNAADQPSPTQTQNNPVNQVQSARRKVAQAAVAPRVRDSVNPRPDENDQDDFAAGVALAEREISQGII